MRTGPPEPPAIFIGSAMTQAPVGGSSSRFATFSRPGHVRARSAIWWTMKSFDGPWSMLGGVDAERADLRASRTSSCAASRAVGREVQVRSRRRACRRRGSACGPASARPSRCAAGRSRPAGSRRAAPPKPRRPRASGGSRDPRRPWRGTSITTAGPISCSSGICVRGAAALGEVDRRVEVRAAVLRRCRSVGGVEEARRRSGRTRAARARSRKARSASRACARRTRTSGPPRGARSRSTRPCATRKAHTAAQRRDGARLHGCLLRPG